MQRLGPIGGSERAMPRISTFYGIFIYMYFSDHAPPHFHAIYGENEAAIDIATSRVIDGTLPRRGKSLVQRWCRLHQAELMVNWRLARVGQPLQNIAPLD